MFDCQDSCILLGSVVYHYQLMFFILWHSPRFSLWFVRPRFFFFLFLFSFRESFFCGFGMQLFNSITMKSYGNSIYSIVILWHATKSLLLCIQLLWDYSQTCWLGTLECILLKILNSIPLVVSYQFWPRKKIISIMVKKIKIKRDFIPYLPNWRWTKMRVSDEIWWNLFHSIPSSFYPSKQYNTNSLHCTPSHSINPNIG